MTVIVGILSNGHVYMGADSASVADLELSLETKPKVFRRDDFIIGFTGSFRMGQLIEYSLTIPPLEGSPTNAYMVKEFVNALRECLRDGGLLKKENDIEWLGWCFIIGCRGRLFRINGDFGVSEMQEGYDAIGCGAQNAIGALAAMEKVAGYLNGMARVQVALDVAERHCIGVRGPMRVITDDPLMGEVLASDVNTASVTSNGA